MELNKYTKRLLAELEDEIGWETYNSKSYNGWTGEEGCSFRYPVNIPCADTDKPKKIKKWSEYEELLKSVTLEQLQDMHYKFGANELYIGQGILNVLKYLEKRYNIDFEELEKEFRNQNASQDYFDQRHCVINNIIEEHTLCIRKFTDEEKCYKSPYSQLVWVWMKIGDKYIVKTCANGTEIHLEQDEIIGEAKVETVEEWHNRYGVFNEEVQRYINRY